MLCYGSETWHLDQQLRKKTPRIRKHMFKAHPKHPLVPKSNENYCTTKDVSVTDDGSLFTGRYQMLKCRKNSRVFSSFGAKKRRISNVESERDGNSEVNTAVGNEPSSRPHENVPFGTESRTSAQQISANAEVMKAEINIDIELDIGSFLTEEARFPVKQSRIYSKAF